MIVLQSQVESAKHRGGRNTYLTLQRVQARVDLYGGRCFYCGNKAECLDHRIAVTHRPWDGSVNWPSNIVPSCRECNAAKWTRCRP